MSSPTPQREERFPGTFARTRKLLREVALAFPESSEVIAWGHPTWRAGKKIFATLGIYYDGEVCFGFKPTEASYRRLVKDPRCFIPPYVGHQGWLSMRVRGPLDRAEVRELCDESYRQVALVRMVKQLDAERPAAPPAKKKRPSRKP